EIDRGKDSNACDKRQNATKQEVAIFQRSEIDHGALKREASYDKEDPADAGDPGAGPDSPVVEPVPAGSLLKHVFKGAERNRHQRDAGIIRVLEEAQIRLVDVDQKRGQKRN